MKFAFLSVTYAGQFYNGPALTILEQIRKARALGFDVATLRASLPDGCDARRWATAIAITWLERDAAPQAIFRALPRLDRPRCWSAAESGSELDENAVHALLENPP